MEREEKETTRAAAHSLLRHNWYLYLTEFFSGMAVMAVELGASRLLAPYFSSSQIVWTIIIGTIMIAMALGNVWGGRQADRHPEPGRLYVRLIVAAVWIAAIPVVGKYLILLVSGLLILTISHQFLVLAAFLTCLLLFVFPLFLLGTVTPSLAKYTIDSLEDNGKTVGALGAFNTIGSILGTFLPTFVTIPAVGTSITFLLFSGILLALGLAYFLSVRGKRGVCAAGALLYLLCALFGRNDSFAFWQPDLLYEGESIYNYLQVRETPSSVILSTNVLFGVQSIRKKDGSLTGMYYDYALAAPLMAGAASGKDEPDILILGMGTGTYAEQCSRYFPGARIEGVEIDGRITELASRYFALPEDIPVTTYDGRAYLQAVDRTYDVIMVDAYQDITIPFQMSSVEFFTMVKEHLNEGGVMVVNMNMRSDRAGGINECLSDTIARVFGTVCTVNVPGATNRELFASDRAGLDGALEDAAARLGDGDLKRMMGDVARGLEPYRAGDCLLTDDKAPVELLGMQVIDDLIQGEIGYYKDVFYREGLSGLLRSV